MVFIRLVLLQRETSQDLNGMWGVWLEKKKEKQLELETFGPSAESGDGKGQGPLVGKLSSSSDACSVAGCNYNYSTRRY